jgi:glutathione S-transferase
MNEALDRLERTLVRMESAIKSSGGPWLQGARPTLADVAVMPAIVRMADLGLGKMWSEKPLIARWYDAIRAHPAFKPTYYFGSLLSEKFPHLRKLA